METRYYLVWRNRFLTADAESIEDMIAGLEGAAQQLREMQEAGVWLDDDAEGDYAYLVTEDEDVAAEYGFEEEEEEPEYDEDDDEDEDEDEDDEFYDEDYEDETDEDYN